MKKFTFFMLINMIVLSNCIQNEMPNKPNDSQTLFQLLQNKSQLIELCKPLKPENMGDEVEIQFSDTCDTDNNFYVGYYDKTQLNGKIFEFSYINGQLQKEQLLQEFSFSPPNNEDGTGHIATTNRVSISPSSIYEADLLSGNEEFTVTLNPGIHYEYCKLNGSYIPSSEYTNDDEFTIIEDVDNYQIGSNTVELKVCVSELIILLIRTCNYETSSANFTVIKTLDADFSSPSSTIPGYSHVLSQSCQGGVLPRTYQWKINGSVVSTNTSYQFTTNENMFQIEPSTGYKVINVELVTNDSDGHTDTKSKKIYYTRPSAPSISFGTPSANKPKIQWTGIYGVTNYKVYRKTGTSAYDLVANTTSNYAYDDDGAYTVQLNENYVEKTLSYKVIACNSYYQSGNSNIIFDDFWVMGIQNPF